MPRLTYAWLFSARTLCLYGIVSSASLAAVLMHATNVSPTVYEAAESVQRSRASVLVLGNTVAFLSLLLGRIAQVVFFGPLRMNEVDMLRDTFWMNLFKGTFMLAFLYNYLTPGYVLVELLSCFGTLAESLITARIESIGQMTSYPRFFFVRLTASVLVVFAAKAILASGLLIALLLAPEQGPMPYIYALSETMQFLGMWIVVLRYACARYELWIGGQWSRKTRVIAYGELAIKLVALSLYIAFLFTPYLFGIVPDLSFTLTASSRAITLLSSVVHNIVQLYRFREATHNMDERYQTVSDAEVAQMGDPTCIICREEFVSHAAHTNVPKRLRCGHVFHSQCLVSWLERQQSCPTCRQTVFESSTTTMRHETQNRQGDGAVPQEPPAAENNRPQVRDEIRALADFAERLRAVTELAPEETQQQRFAQRIFHNDALNPRNVTERVPDEDGPSSKEESPREAARRATLSRMDNSTTAAPPGPVLIPLFDPARIPEYFDKYAPQLPHPLAPWVSPGV